MTLATIYMAFLATRSRMIAPSINWRLERSLYSPPFVYSVAKGVREDIELSRPFGKGVRLTKVCEDPIASPVAILRLLACPSTVFRRIRAVIVYAIQRPPWRAISHVMMEGFKRFQPGFADGNASTTIPLKISSKWIGATSFHTVPNLIFAGSCSAVTHVSTKASARMATGSFKDIERARHYCSTMAYAEPNTLLPRVFLNRGYNEKFSEYLERQVVGLFNWAYNFVRHFGISSIECLGRTMGCRPSFC